MKKTFTLFTALLISAISFGQLVPGDIAFIGYNSDWINFSDREVFTWIALDDIAVGAVIYFTDEGVHGSFDNFNDSNEGHYSFTVTGFSALQAGTIITVKGNATGLYLADSSINGVLKEEVAGWDLDNDGDQILAYTSTNGARGSNANFIAGIHADRDTTCEDEDIEDLGWSDNESSCVSFEDDSTSHSELPQELTNGVNAVAILGFSLNRQEMDNARYNGNFTNDTSLNLTGGTNSLRALINDRTKWSHNDQLPISIDASDYPTPNICIDAEISFIDSDASDTVCTDNQITLTINGDLNDADEWHVYSDELGDNLVGTTTTNTITLIQPEQIVRYYVRGEYVNNNTCVSEGELERESVQLTDEYDSALFRYTTEGDNMIADMDTEGGIFTSSPEGLSINSSTGNIDISESIPGKKYTVTYTTQGACGTFFSLDINIPHQLKAGDIAFIGYNSDAITGEDVGDNFSWITLVDLFPLQQIYFTTQGVIDNAFINTTEGHVRWTAPSEGVPAGTIIHINERFSNNLSSNIGDNTSILFGSTWAVRDNDQILAYTSTETHLVKSTNPTFLAGLHFDYDSSCFNTTTRWTTSTCVDGVSESTLPTGLTNAKNAVSLFISDAQEKNNAKYNGSLSGEPDALRTMINNRTNWTASDTYTDIEPDDYTVGVICFAVDTTISYESASYSSDDLDPLPTIIGIADGEFTSDGVSGDIDLIMNAITGKVDLSASDFGTHVIRYTVPNSCGGDFTTEYNITIVDPSLSIGDITDNLNNVTIYKSSNQTVTINGLNSSATVSIYNLLGQQIASKTIDPDNSNTINLSKSISAGVYIVRLSSEQGNVTKKVILN